MQVESKQTTTFRLMYGDAVRILGSMAVVIIHVCADGMPQYTTIPFTSWLNLLCLDSLSRWCVPIFIMLSGALLLDPGKKQTLTEFYSKRFKRVGYPLIFWTVVYLIWDAYFIRHGIRLGHISLSILQGLPYYHLHFMFALVGLYAVTPFLREILDNRNGRVSLQAITICLLMGVLNDIALARYSGGMTATTLFVQYIGFFLAGYRLRQGRLNRRQIAAALTGFIISVGLTMVWAVYGLHQHYRYSMISWSLDYLSPMTITSSITMWLLLRHFFSEGAGKRLMTQQWIINCGRATLGIYLIHPLIKEILQNQGFCQVSTYSLADILSVSLTIWMISLVCTIAMLKVKPMRLFIGG